MILAGDIGGTNSRLAIFDGTLNKLAEQVYKNAGRDGLVGIVEEFRAGPAKGHTFDRACFAVAGPVSMGRVTLTNLSWTLDEQDLAGRWGLPPGKVALVNDLVGHAEGIEVLTPDRIVTLHAGEPVPDGNRAIIAAGTGLGEAGLVFDRRTGRYRSFASEGGHCDFAPRNSREDRLLSFLRGRFGNVSFENVLSGRGLRNLYDFVLTEPALAGSGLPNPDPQPADITRAALDRSNPAAVEAMNLFVSIYGAEAGHLALKTLATGGVYVGGGIAPRILPFLTGTDAFLAGFRNHSVPKMQQMLERIPVHVITFELNGLYGAANSARSL
jgi:glucokinase